MQSGNESDDNSMIPPLLCKEEIDAMDSAYDSKHDLISMDMLENICDGSKSHLNINQRGACYKIRDYIRQRQLDWKGALKAMQNIGKSLHKVFKNVVRYISQD